MLYIDVLSPPHVPAPESSCRCELLAYRARVNQQKARRSLRFVRSSVFDSTAYDSKRDH